MKKIHPNWEHLRALEGHLKALETCREVTPKEFGKAKQQYEDYREWYYEAMQGAQDSIENAMEVEE